MSTAGRSSSPFSFALGAGAVVFVAISTLALLFGLVAAFSPSEPTLTMSSDYLAAFIACGVGGAVIAPFALLLALTTR